MMHKPLKGTLRTVFLVALVWVSACGLGCQKRNALTRETFGDTLTALCKEKFQAHVACKEAGDTVWLYLPYTSGRQGNASVEEKPQGVKYDLNIEYFAASFNPYRVMNPDELTFLQQGICREIRGLLLRCVRPYTFFVLVTTNIESPNNEYDYWSIGYLNDVRDFGVGKKTTGEGDSRLVRHSEPITIPRNEKGEMTGNSPSFRDIRGGHVEYRDIVLRDFLEKQIKWRIYKTFTMDYNMFPFDMTAEEKEGRVKQIIATVLNAYHSNDFVTITLKDISFLDEHETAAGYSAESLKQYHHKGKIRRPAF